LAKGGIQIIALEQFQRIAGMVVGQGVEQCLVRIRSQGHVHRSYPFIEAKHAFDVFDGLVEQMGDLFGGWFVIEFLGQFARRAQVDVQFLDHVNRQANGAGLVHDRPLDRLPDPPGGIGGKTETALGIEFLDGSDKP
jgi:hypothetical protein